LGQESGLCLNSKKRFEFGLGLRKERAIKSAEKPRKAGGMNRRKLVKPESRNGF
jgi:hypothetical protein